jgi:hypothetical protein
MCYNFNLFYVLYFKFLYNYFLKFVIHKINSEMVKLTVREKIGVADTDVAMRQML